ncbi:hypothetical protein [Cohnella sp.]|uniref:hypothetical protein n=1 Tax=Cohnella sp. TaxID=1883426 RepID=UPI003703AD78
MSLNGGAGSAGKGLVRAGREEFGERARDEIRGESGECKVRSVREKFGERQEMRMKEVQEKVR